MTTSSRWERHQRILDLVRSRPIATQAELAARLRAAGVRADQATLSRDIRELGLVKIASGGTYRYSPVEEASPPPPRGQLGLLKRFVRSIEFSGNLVLVKTDSGAAMPVAEALDRLSLREILGTVAGDNTVLVVVRAGYSAKSVAWLLKRRWEGPHLGMPKGSRPPRDHRFRRNTG